MIVKRLVLGPLSTNCYVAMCEKTHDAIVIDPADNGEAILNTLKSLGAVLRFVVLTHCHFDHAGAAAMLCEKEGASLVCHEKESGSLSSPAINLSGRFGFPEIILYPDKTVTEGDQITFGDTSLKVISTPGHTVGGMCLYGENVLFSGDTLFAGSIGRTDFPGGSFETIESSIREKLYVLPEETAVYSGHGEPTTIGREKRENMYVR